MLCKNCGRNIPDDAKFCGYCRTKNETETGEDVTDTIGQAPVKALCPSCGTPIEPGAMFCGECGYCFDKKETEDIARPTPEKQKATPVTKDTYRKNNAKGKNGNILIYVLSAVAIIFACCCIFLLLKYNMKNKDDFNASVETEAASEYIAEDEDFGMPENDGGVYQDNDGFDEQIPETIYEENDDYLFPSDREYITFEDLEGLTQDEVALIRNEIYARHGYVFQTEPFKSYFAEKDWYVPNPELKSSDAMFSEIELKNKNTIVEYETQKGWR